MATHEPVVCVSVGETCSVWIALRRPRGSLRFDKLERVRPICRRLGERIETAECDGNWGFELWENVKPLPALRAGCPSAACFAVYADDMVNGH